MTPFQEFRLWARRAPIGERLAAAVAAVLVMAVLVWVLVPSKTTADKLDAFPPSGTTGAESTTGGSTGTTGTSGATGTTTGAAPVTTGTTGAAPATTGGSGGATSGATSSTGSVGGATGTTGSSTGSTSGAKYCPAGSATGVTASRIKIAVVLVNIVGPAANSVFNVSSPEQQRTAYTAAIDDVNARGGAGCKQVVPQFFEGNPADQNNLRQICLDVAEAKVFAVLDAGAYSRFPLVDCFARAKIPYFGSFLLSGRLQIKHYPYLFNFNTQDRLYRDTVFGLRDRQFFTAANGLKKLGFIYRNCDGALIDSFKGWLKQAGVSSTQLVSYDVGCPSALVDPSVLQQAILKFQQQGVTHVTTAVFVGDFATFTKLAQQQDFKPKYGLANDNVITLTYGNPPPDYNNLNGAVAITASADAEDRTPGTKMSAGTVRCNAAFAKKNLPPVYKLPATAGNACSGVFMFAAAVSKAPVMQPNALAAGLQAAKSVGLAFPQGPNDFSGNRVTTAGQYWRPAGFTTACNCWRLLDKNYKRSYG